MIRIKTATATLGITAVMAIALACGNDEPASAAGATAPVASTGLPLASAESSAPVTSGFMLPRSNSVEELVSRSDIIVLGTIQALIEEKRIGGYGESGKPRPAGEDSNPVTDYLVRIEEVLKADDRDSGADTLVLRIFGHRSGQGGAITLTLFEHPDPGDHLLFALGRNPDGTYGSGPEGMIDVDGDVVVYADGQPFAGNLAPDQFVREVKGQAGG